MLIHLQTSACSAGGAECARIFEGIFAYLRGANGGCLSLKRGAERASPSGMHPRHTVLSNRVETKHEREQCPMMSMDGPFGNPPLSNCTAAGSTAYPIKGLFWGIANSVRQTLGPLCGMLFTKFQGGLALT